MQIHVIEKKVDRYRVVHQDGHLGVRSNDLDALAGRGNIEVLNCLEYIVANLIFRLAFHDAKTGNFLALVSQLVFRGIRRNQLKSCETPKRQNQRNDNRLQLALASLRSKSAHLFLERKQWSAPAFSRREFFLPAQRSTALGGCR